MYRYIMDGENFFVCTPGIDTHMYIYIVYYVLCIYTIYTYRVCGVHQTVASTSGRRRPIVELVIHGRWSRLTQA